jgi:hypothetical protein
VAKTLNKVQLHKVVRWPSGYKLDKLLPAPHVSKGTIEIYINREDNVYISWCSPIELRWRPHFIRQR